MSLVSRVLAGPFCTMMLGDAGADVIKVEKPGVGDDTRRWGPPFAKALKPGDHDVAAYFLSVNRNKRSITVDFTKDAGLEILRNLAAVSDVLVENYLPGKLDHYGLGYAQLKKVNPRLVYCSITGYGQSGPYANRGGYDLVATAMGGLMSVTGPEDGEPCKAGIAIADLASGMFAHSGILTALLNRSTTGEGQHVSANLLDSQVTLLTNVASNYLISGMDGRRWGTSHASIVPYQAFQTKDGHIIIACGNDLQFKHLCEVLGCENTIGLDPKYQINSSRVTHRQELIEKLSRIFVSQTSKHWQDALGKTTIPHGPLNKISEVFSDPQVIHNEMIQEVDHPTLGMIKLTGFPVEFSDSKCRIRLPPPLVGEHTDEVLRSLLSYSDSKVESLRMEDVI